MNRRIDNTKLFVRYRQRITRKAQAQFFLTAVMLTFTAVLLVFSINSVNAVSSPQTLRSDIKIRNVTSTASTTKSVRLVKDPRNNTLYYLKQNGEIYRVNLGSTTTSTLVYSSSEHNLSETQGMAIGPNGTIYLVGNADLINDQTAAIIAKGEINTGTGERVWFILAKSEGYPKSKTAYDHRFNGVVVSTKGDFIYVNSGSRTDHGEVQSTNGLYPDTREVGLTACILRLPTNGQNLSLVNDRATLKSAGYIFAEGTRNTFDMAFAPNGDLFGTENAPDRSMPEELNWLRQNLHYGFPWRIGGLDNPQQFPNYDPTKDPLLDSRFNAVQKGYYRNDPTFPARPNITLTEPITNSGPDADSFRDPQNGQIKDASVLGQTLSTFTAHRSPLGLVFDTQAAMSPEFQGDGFMLSWKTGDPTGATVAGPFKDPSQDLLHLNLARVGSNSYKLSATRIAGGFSNPIDAEIIGNKIYVLEYGGSQGIWEITMPTNQGILLPVIDAYVRGGSYSGTNSGTDTTLLVKKSNNAALNREAYFKFNLSSVSTIAQAKLRIYAASTTTSPVTTTIFPVANTSWTETGITWNNRPTRSAALTSKTINGTTSIWYELDVTNYLKSEKAAGRNIVSLALANATVTKQLLKLNSREATVNRPQLVIIP